MKRRLREYDLDAVAGVVAAVAALVLHLLHVVDQEVILAVVLAVLALLLIRDLRSEARDERLGDTIMQTAQSVAGIGAALVPPDAILVGPRRLRRASEEFARAARGEMVWFNVCLLMFRPQPLFDSLLRPAIENPAVMSVQFVLDHGERERWKDDVLPKVARCNGAAKVREPRWCDLHESVSFILSETLVGGVEAHLSFWGEPFMARQTGHDVPRYIFHVQQHSELVMQLVELDRRYRLQG